MTLTCPKCQGEWRQYERNGVTIDQCTECRGIFLDRGELDRLIDAENAFYGQDASASEPAAAPQAPQQAPQAPPPAPSYGQPQYAPPPAYGGAPQSYPPAQPGYGYPSHGHHKRKKSFLDELFD